MGKTLWKLTLAYDGTEFHGWQVQQDHLTTPTIQGALANAIAAVTGERVLPQGSGRTDAGVHALGQVASFPLEAPIPPRNLLHSLNRVLPIAIRVVAAEPAAPDFHARHSAIGKIYRYRIFQGAVCSPFLARYVTCSYCPLDVAAMQTAAQTILGEHDFTSFAATDPDRATRLQEQRSSLSRPDLSDLDVSGLIQSNVRRIAQSYWSCAALPSPAEALKEPDLIPQPITGESTAQILTYTVRGNGFLHHMVRNLVGTFLDVGRGRTAPAAMADILNGRDRSLAGPTAPANGLCLVEVLY